MISGKSDCGMQYAVRRRSSGVGYCALSIRCGTRDEKGYHGGIAHFVEHTIFKGTRKRSASVINGYLDRLGGELNAYTTKEEIVLHATVLKEDLSKASSLLFELATEATFPEHEIETEKGVVIDEIQSYKDTPSEDIYDRFEELLFKGHPLSGNILGTTASVRKITRDELLKFVREKFQPCRMAFTVVADIDEKLMEKRVLKLIDKYFGDSHMEDATQTVSVLSPSVFDKTLNKRNHQANCIIGGLAPSLYEEKERLATVLLCNILGGPANNSILNSVLREKNGWVYGVECSYTQYADTGIVAISLGCDKNNIDKCVEVVYKETARLQESLLTESKLKSAKKQLLGQLAVSGDNGETQCLSMGKGLLSFGKLNSGEENKEMIEAITAEEIRQMARRIFNRDNLSRLIYI
ncbi:MAG: insulinase family protein [Bacteroidales bacterium]|nr:insulinase family protein [Bacteroidales bacterium]